MFLQICLIRQRLKNQDKNQNIYKVVLYNKKKELILESLGLVYYKISKKLNMTYLVLKSKRIRNLLTYNVYVTMPVKQLLNLNLFFKRKIEKKFILNYNIDKKINENKKNKTNN